jgi:alpha-tubulin suppressor-like RCC1 family protein
MALTESGYVYSWGNNPFGQLGHNTTNDLNKPSIVILSDTILIKK